MRLTELEPVLLDIHPTEEGYQRFSFLCPSCRMLRETIAIWHRRHAELKLPEGGSIRVWEATQGPHRDWDTLSLMPSVDLGAHKRGEGTCPGWHGFITDGEVK